MCTHTHTHPITPYMSTKFLKAEQAKPEILSWRGPEVIFLSFPHLTLTEHQRGTLESHSYFFESSSRRSTTIALLLLTHVFIIELEGALF